MTLDVRIDRHRARVIRGAVKMPRVFQPPAPIKQTQQPSETQNEEKAVITPLRPLVSASRAPLLLFTSTSIVRSKRRTLLPRSMPSVAIDTDESNSELIEARFDVNEDHDHLYDDTESKSSSTSTNAASEAAARPQPTAVLSSSSSSPPSSGSVELARTPSVPTQTTRYDSDSEGSRILRLTSSVHTTAAAEAEVPTDTECELEPVDVDMELEEPLSGRVDPSTVVIERAVSKIIAPRPPSPTFSPMSPSMESEPEPNLHPMQAEASVNDGGVRRVEESQHDLGQRARAAAVELPPATTASSARLDPETLQHVQTCAADIDDVLSVCSQSPRPRRRLKRVGRPVIDTASIAMKRQKTDVAQSRQQPLNNTPTGIHPSTAASNVPAPSNAAASQQQPAQAAVVTKDSAITITANNPSNSTIVKLQPQQRQLPVAEPKTRAQQLDLLQAITGHRPLPKSLVEPPPSPSTLSVSSPIELALSPQSLQLRCYNHLIDLSLEIIKILNYYQLNKLLLTDYSEEELLSVIESLKGDVRNQSKVYFLSMVRLVIASLTTVGVSAANNHWGAMLATATAQRYTRDSMQSLSNSPLRFHLLVERVSQALRACCERVERQSVSSMKHFDSAQCESLIELIDTIHAHTSMSDGKVLVMIPDSLSGHTDLIKHAWQSRAISEVHGKLWLWKRPHRHRSKVSVTLANTSTHMADGANH